MDHIPPPPPLMKMHLYKQTKYVALGRVVNILTLPAYRYAKRYIIELQNYPSNYLSFYSGYGIEIGDHIIELWDIRNLNYPVKLYVNNKLIASKHDLKIHVEMKKLLNPFN